MIPDATPAPGDSLTRLHHALRCVACKGSLDVRKESLACRECGTEYTRINGCPVLMTPEGRQSFNLHLETDAGQNMVREYTTVRPANASVRISRWKAWLRWLKPPEMMYRYHPDLRAPPTAILFAPVDGHEPLVLSVGGGPFRVTGKEITLNIGTFPNVDMVADAHEIPVADDTFDAVFSLAVLEHVGDPQQVVAEMIRVLKPGGYLYSEIPFIFFFHGYPTDYTRFTREGMRRLFGGLQDAEIGMTHGPVSAVLQSANMLIPMLMPARPRLLGKLASGAFRWLFFPCKYLDLLLRDHPRAHILAGGFYVLGRKPAKS